MARGQKKAAADDAIDALCIEATRRGKRMNRPDYSYGKLVADTTEAERLGIVEKYRARKRRKQVMGGTRSYFDEADEEGAGD